MRRWSASPLLLGLRLTLIMVLLVVALGLQCLLGLIDPLFARCDPGLCR